MSVACRYNVTLTSLFFLFFTLNNIQTVWYTDKNSLSFLVMVVTAKTSATEAENNQITYATEAFKFMFAILVR